MWAQLIISFDHTLPEPLPSVTLSITQSEPESKGTLWFSSTFFAGGGGGMGLGFLWVKCLHRLMDGKFKKARFLEG